MLSTLRAWRPLRAGPPGHLSVAQGGIEPPASLVLSCAAWEAAAWAARPRARLAAEGEGVEPSRLVARPDSSRVPSPVGLPFRWSRDGWIGTSVLVRPRHATTPGWSTSRDWLPCESHKRSNMVRLPFRHGAAEGERPRRESNPHAGFPTPGSQPVCLYPSAVGHGRQSTQWGSNPRALRGRQGGCRSIMGAAVVITALAKSRTLPAPRKRPGVAWTPGLGAARWGPGVRVAADRD